MQDSEYWASTTQGSFFDVVVDFTSAEQATTFDAVTGNLHSIYFFLQNGTTTPFFIDYIKVIYK